MSEDKQGVEPFIFLAKYLVFIKIYPNYSTHYSTQALKIATKIATNQIGLSITLAEFPTRIISKFSFSNLLRQLLHDYFHLVLIKGNNYGTR